MIVIGYDLSSICPFGLSILLSLVFLRISMGMNFLCLLYNNTFLLLIFGLFWGVHINVSCIWVLDTFIRKLSLGLLNIGTDFLICKGIDIDSGSRLMEDLSNIKEFDTWFFVLIMLLT